MLASAPSDGPAVVRRLGGRGAERAPGEDEAEDRDRPSREESDRRAGHRTDRIVARASSWSTPLLAKTLGVQIVSSPSNVVRRPPASRMTGVERRDVPGLQVELAGEVDRALGEQHVRPEIPEGARAPHRAAQGDEGIEIAGVIPALQAVVAQRRLGERVDPADPDRPRLLVADAHPRAVTGRSPPADDRGPARSRRPPAAPRRSRGRAACPRSARRERSSRCRRSGR